MTDKKILFISQEIEPYLPESEMANIGRYLPQGIQEKGKEIRTFMPRFGCINERRNQLHEVIRLSGMNLIIDDTDHPLIIKVASIQAARMQVYFIDNDDYFTRKHTVLDDESNLFEDNDERAIFFAKGVFETVKKLRWNPDLIYCQGWFTSMIPLLLKKEYSEDPSFSNSKVVFSCCNDDFKGSLDKSMSKKLINGNILAKDLTLLQNPNYENVCKFAIHYSDGVIINHKDVNPNIVEYANKAKKPVLQKDASEDYIDAYNSFFDSLLDK